MSRCLPCLVAAACGLCHPAFASGGKALPAPVDVPRGPEGIAGPGGQALPQFGAPSSVGAPAISAASDVTFPDETLVVTGDNLAGARLRVWMEGRIEDLEPMRTAGNRAQAVVPKHWPLSTMLVWPVRDAQAGLPIRVNGATLWWCWPARVAPQEAAWAEVDLMGKNLAIARAEPQVYLAGADRVERLPLRAASPYRLSVRLPADLKPGRYELFAHNGTGGAFGWSAPAFLDVVAPSVPVRLPEFDVDRFGAKPNDGRDDAPAIQQAVAAAVAARGGKVRFSAGTYHLGQAVLLPDAPGAGIHLQGAGMGDFDAKEQRPGPGTVLRFLPDGALPDCLLRVACPGSSVCDLSLVGGHPGIVRAIHDRDAPRRVVIHIAGHDVRLERVRMTMLDLRPRVAPEKRLDLQIYDPALHLVAPGRAQIVVRDCEFHSAGAGIEIGTMSRGHGEDGFPDPSTDYVRIEKCVFRGYSPGFYKEPADPRSYAHMGIFNEGIQIPNAKNVIIAGCDFAGADRRGGKMIGRSICVYNTSVRELYIADNRSHDVGMVCARQDRVVNQGEQILFHFRYPYGGYFDVLAAGPSEVTVDPADPRNAGRLSSPHTAFDRTGSRVLDEVGTNDHWVLFVSAGKGAGQYRVVTAAERRPHATALKLDRPWRVVPDRSSRVTLTTANRQNIVCGNTIDAGFIDPRCKVAGVLFWFNGFENVIAGNTLRNLGYGVGFNSSFRNPCCWNLVRDNTMEHMGGMAVEALEPAFYFDSCRTSGGPGGPLFQSGSDVAGWYAVGNVARSNRGSDSPTAAFVHALTNEAGSRLLPEATEAGVAMPVVENSRFTGVKRGIVVNRGAVWPVLRGNTLQTLAPDSP